MICYLNMDTLADYVEGIFKLFGREKDYYTKPWPANIYSASAVIGTSDEEILKRISQSSNFWQDLKPFVLADKLVLNLIEAFGSNLYIVSTVPTENCILGKSEWLKKHFYSFFQVMQNENILKNQIIFVQRQTILAKPDIILIDDDAFRCREFIKAGGRAILYPQCWNKLRQINSIAYVQLQLYLNGL